MRHAAADKKQTLNCTLLAHAPLRFVDIQLQTLACALQSAICQPRLYFSVFQYINNYIRQNHRMPGQ